MQDYTYVLPPERVAARPLHKRDESKLLVYKSGKIEEGSFVNLAYHLPEGATLILNNTKVIAARVFFTKQSGGVIEIFCLEPFRQSIEASLQQQGSAEWVCMIGGASKWKPGLVLQKALRIDGTEVQLEARYLGKAEDAFIIQFSWQPAHIHLARVLQVAGDIPLPPYIKRTAELTDKERYQTIFAKQEGSVAAPTAALHFSTNVFESLRRKDICTAQVTLHVGAGTFRPVKTPSIADHPMHSESFAVKRKTLDAILNATTVVAVGTTSLRTIESLHWLGVKLLAGEIKQEWVLGQWEAYNLDGKIDYRQSLGAIVNWMEKSGVAELHCRTALLIVPGYEFKIPAALITNFHQPGSTLLLLVAALIGDDWKEVYRHALENDFRFLSYGDSSLLWRTQLSKQELPATQS